jgi:hypothetical protein
MAEAVVESLKPAVGFFGGADGAIGIDGEIGDADVLAEVFEEHGGWGQRAEVQHTAGDPHLPLTPSLPLGGGVGGRGGVRGRWVMFC